MRSNIILSDNNGHYISLAPTQRPIIVDDVQKAFKWKNITKAQNALNHLSNEIRSNNTFSLSSFSTTTNKSPLKSKDFLNGLISDLPLDELSRNELDTKLSQADKALTDFIHFIEMSNFNVFEGFVVMKLYQRLLLHRRKIKDKMLMLDEAVTPFELKSRCYHPRIIKELFR